MHSKILSLAEQCEIHSLFNGESPKFKDRDTCIESKSSVLKEAIFVYGRCYSWHTCK